MQKHKVKVFRRIVTIAPQYNSKVAIQQSLLKFLLISTLQLRRQSNRTKLFHLSINKEPIKADFSDSTIIPT